MASNDAGYNGYTNYETWAVKLWIDNDQGSQEYWLAQARSAHEQAKRKQLASWETVDNYAHRLLTNMLKGEHKQNMPELAGIYSDLMLHALGRVDWRQLAEHLFEDAREIPA